MQIPAAGPRVHTLGALALAIGVSLSLVPADSADASPTADTQGVPERLVVTGDRVRAVIETRPFRLSILDADGRTVLQQVPNEGAPPGVSLVTDPPGGSDTFADQAVYAPFTFEVGGQGSAQFPASPWVGAMIGAGHGGVQYSAREVTDVQQIKDGLRLVLSTNDPQGREIVARIRPDEAGSVAVSMRVTPDEGVSAVGDSFLSPADEAFHGFGGRHTRVNQRGRTLTGWIQAQNVSAGQLQPAADAVPGTSGEEYLFPNGPSAAYYAHNSFVSSRGYGFVLDRSELTRWRIADERSDAWQVDAAGSALDYLVAPGGPRRAVSAVTAINGRHRLPPVWAQGTTLYRGVKVLSADADTPESYEAKVRADLRRIDRHRLEVTAYGLEGWAILDKPVLKDLVAEFHERGINLHFYLRCFASADPANTEPPQLFTEAIEGGYVTTTAAGTPYLFGSTFVAGAAVLIDFTNPEAVRWWRERLHEMLDLGADGFMQDFGEQVLADMHFADGSTGATMHNAYPTLYHRTTRRIVDAYREKHPGSEVFFFTRAGFSGRPGSAAHESANFPGDETTDWTLSSGLP